MRIAVCIKQVPDVKSVRMDVKTGTVVRSGRDAVINPLDSHAVELALQLRERCGGTVTALTMGPPAAEKALRECAALGVDRLVLISDAAFAGSDTWATANILTAALLHEGPFDLIVCGERATDGDTSQVGPEIAAALDWPVATYVHEFIPAADGRTARLARRIEAGVEVYQALLPLVITVGKEVGTVRLPTFRGVVASRQQELIRLSNRELKLAPERIGLAGSPTRVLKVFTPSITRECRKFAAGTEAEIAAAVRAAAREVRP